jgi:hypothetical protein
MDTPRVLKVSFEFRIPPGLRTNVHASRVESAVASFSAVMHGLAGTVFPDVAGLDYRDVDHTGTASVAEGITLPATDKNTVEPTDDVSSAA